MFAQVLQHLAEYRPLLDCLRRITRLNKLGSHLGFHRHRASLALFPLGSDREAVRINVYAGFHLSWRRDAQVQNSF